MFRKNQACYLDIGFGCSCYLIAPAALNIEIKLS